MVAKNNLCVLVLAGGKGTRMKSVLPKPLHKICGAEILSHILKEAQALKPARIGVLIGHQAELVRETVKNNLQNWGIKTPVDFILQKELTGSGTAAKDSAPFMRRYGQILILAGDAPLIQAATLRKLIQTHNKTKAACTVFTVDIDNPRGYGRILKDAKGNFTAIIEESETNAATAAIKEVNSGMYIFDVKALLGALPLLKPQGPKKEYYLTDTLALLKQKGLRVEVFKAADYKEAMGINSKKQLAQAAAIMQAAVNDALMESGVTIINPRDTYIEPAVKIGADSIIYPGAFIKGNTVIGARCVIGPCCWIEDSVLAEEVHLKTGCYLTQASLAKGCIAGPYAHLRPAAVLKENAKIGNFVEIKKSVIGAGSKVPHLTYVGDSEIGSKVNIGAGTITCNYDGVNKYKTVIGDGVFVGSNTNFVAPVVVGKGAKIGAGSTITQDIPAAMLAIARARQVNLIIKNKKKDKKK
ncbi:MAG: bifunctional UDP-N-acetylglucosamine diphosphorylase/glucosamine-1-phosphate N-acetyltransferase GlmU [Elusimicrobiota bacterium]|jgi:bifunctional UDP-N-acetylglucosamine pyrophosphorylase/glucosamine-1-phosphate N-acetyltransferase|nr:bifunctional UDP-N-acetylglucosamine diphosphorylase/glucosamine-1-phosphate N-acetyltransferase GlmU [Elusimicrobiota bacterium]